MWSFFPVIDHESGITDITNFVSLLLYKTEISIKAQANISSLLIRNSFTSMNSKLGNDVTDDNEKRYFGEYLIDEQASGETEADIDS